MENTLFADLRESHDLQRALCTRLVRARPGTPAKTQAFLALRTELGAHAASEERYLYAPILMDDAGLTPSRHALAEHHHIEELLEEMSVPDKATPGWHQQAQTLSRLVRHHLKEEERGFFQQAGKILTEAQKFTLAARYRKDVARMRRVLAGG